MAISSCVSFFSTRRRLISLAISMLSFATGFALTVLAIFILVSLDGGGHILAICGLVIHLAHEMHP